MENINEDQGVQFAAADWIEKENQAFALVLAAAQNQQLLQEWLDLPYYEQQKTWLAESCQPTWLPNRSFAPSSTRIG